MLDMYGSLHGYTAARSFLCLSLSPPPEGLPLTLSETLSYTRGILSCREGLISIDRYTAAHPFPCPGALSSARRLLGRRSRGTVTLGPARSLFLSDPVGLEQLKTK